MYFGELYPAETVTPRNTGVLDTGNESASKQNVQAGPKLAVPAQERAPEHEPAQAPAKIQRAPQRQPDLGPAPVPSAAPAQNAAASLESVNALNWSAVTRRRGGGTTTMSVQE